MRYKEYKKVDIPWLNKVPSHWEIKNVNNLFDERREKVSDKDYPPLSVTKNGILPQLENVAKSMASDNRKKVLEGDFVINSRSDRKGSSGLSSYDGSVSLISTVIKPRLGFNKFWHYLLKSNDFIEEFYRNGKGIVADLWTTNFQSMKSIILPFPQKEEQEQIARFLDWKINEIDRLIDIKKKNISFLLKLKDRYLDYYFGNLIENNSENFSEKYIKIKYLTKIITSNSNEGKHFIGLENIESNTGRILSKIEDLPVKNDGIDVNKNMIIFGKLRPYLAKVYEVEKESKCSSEFLVLECLNNLNSEFMKFLMLSPTFVRLVNESTYGAKMPRANTDFITSIKIKKILLQEQIELVIKTKIFFEKHDLSIKNIQSQINNLQQLKKSLISEVVTGKMDVRNISIPEYDKVSDIEDDAILEENFNEEV
ncbi:MAG: restriction endonuclease subunit S [Peptoniphilus grossensis]|uniref:restriction endonuclease subunit S n=1 Tax=Peptoniphilus grossensis TaxID=1465756 RepID=UPI0025875D4E|nr:restriction endonuclease subunit S [Peptoniphilus grossensis]MDU5099966.1 restriction endonuclease subunit S [Peptoniphilus grossensis]